MAGGGGCEKFMLTPGLGNNCLFIPGNLTKFQEIQVSCPGMLVLKIGSTVQIPVSASDSDWVTQSESDALFILDRKIHHLEEFYKISDLIELSPHTKTEVAQCSACSANYCYGKQCISLSGAAPHLILIGPMSYLHKNLPYTHSQGDFHRYTIDVFIC